jgi:predicted Rossmann fold flavoprotein
MIYDLVVIGAGAGGCFTAIRLSELYPHARICILEAAKRPLGKVEISGGGRCNVTHACFDPELLAAHYPRGGKELVEPFKRFQPKDMIDWFARRNVRIKREADGRMFPDTDSSTTIIYCFLGAMEKAGIELMTSTRAVDINQGALGWEVMLGTNEKLLAKNVLISTGSDQRMWSWLESAGHMIVPPVPSLFTFNINDKALKELQGVSKTIARVSIPSLSLHADGPVLITHWGMSGPGILRLSAWGARELNDCKYTFTLAINWMHDKSTEDALTLLKTICVANPKKQLLNVGMEGFPTRLWKYLCQRAVLPERVNCSEIGGKVLKRLAEVLTNDKYPVTGKSTFKEEFVTAGGVALDEIDFQHFASKRVPNLYLVGEVLNIDAITGGFNFQAAWTGAEIAAQSIAEKLHDAM